MPAVAVPVPASAYFTVTRCPLAALRDTVNARFAVPLSPSNTLGLSIPTVGESSSSSSVSVAPDTAPTWWLFCADAVTVTVRSGSSRALSTALIVAVSAAFEVCPAAIAMVASEPAV